MLTQLLYVVGVMATYYKHKDCIFIGAVGCTSEEISDDKEL